MNMNKNDNKNMDEVNTTNNIKTKSFFFNYYAIMAGGILLILACISFFVGIYLAPENPTISFDNYSIWSTLIIFGNVFIYLGIGISIFSLVKAIIRKRNFDIFISILLIVISILLAVLFLIVINLL